MKSKRVAIIKKMIVIVRVILLIILIPDLRKVAMLFEKLGLIHLELENRPNSPRLFRKSANDLKIAAKLLENDARYAPLGILASGLVLKALSASCFFVALPIGDRFLRSPCILLPGSHSWRENLLQKYSVRSHLGSFLRFARNCLLFKLNGLLCWGPTNKMFSKIKQLPLLTEFDPVYVLERICPSFLAIIS